MEEDPCGGVQVNANPNSFPQTHGSSCVLIVLQGLWTGMAGELFILCLLPAKEMLQDEVKLKFSQSFKIFPHVGPCLAATLKRNLSQKEPAGCPVLSRVCRPGQTWECPNLQLLTRGSGGAALITALG